MSIFRSEITGSQYTVLNNASNVITRNTPNINLDVCSMMNAENWKENVETNIKCVSIQLQNYFLYLVYVCTLQYNVNKNVLFAIMYKKVS